MVLNYSQRDEFWGAYVKSFFKKVLSNKSNNDSGENLYFPTYLPSNGRSPYEALGSSALKMLQENIK